MCEIAWVLGIPSRNASHGSASPLQERVLPLYLNREITQAVFLCSYMGSPEKQMWGGEIMDLKEVSVGSWETDPCSIGLLGGFGIVYGLVDELVLTSHQQSRPRAPNSHLLESHFEGRRKYCLFLWATP